MHTAHPIRFPCCDSIEVLLLVCREVITHDIGEVLHQKIVCDTSQVGRNQFARVGTYDFALDEVESDEGFDEIPEELQETEEDRLLDEKEAEANAKLDKFLNWAWVGVAIAVVGFIIYRIFS